MTANSKAAAQQLRTARGQVVSLNVAKLPDKSLGFTKGFLARDPDGHGLQIIER